MKFLLDTHTFIWFIAGNEQIPQNARQIIEEINNQIYLSVASLWEIAIKLSLGKLELGVSFDELIPEQLIINEITILPIRLKELSIISDLPFHHRDPFDRLIIAQAIAEGFPIIGKDSNFKDYPVDLIW